MTSHIKDITDFIAAGKDLGYEKDELRKYAESEYDKYLKRIEKEEEREEKKKREEEEREERKKREEEKKRIDNYEREMRLLERKEKIAQSEAINNTKATNQETGSESRSPKTPGFKFNPFNEKSCDLDTWFNMFESQCTMYGVKDNDRKSHMMSLFSGQCLEALLALDPKTSYDDIKKALLYRFNLTKHDYRKKFFSMTPTKGETVIAYCQRLNICFDRWIKLADIKNDFPSLRDLILCHKFMDTCNPRISSFLLEQDSNDLKEVEKTATRFLQAHNEEPLGKTLDMPYSSNNAKQFDNRASGFQSDFKSRGRGRGQYGKYPSSTEGYHRSNYGNQNFNKRSDYENQTNNEKTPEQQIPGKERPKKDAREIICHQCGGIGHIRPSCPTKPFHGCNAIMESWRQGPILNLPESLYTKEHKIKQVTEREQHIYPGLIEDSGIMKTVHVLRDTGSMIHAVHSGLVKPHQYTGRTQSLITIGGKKETFRLATITVDTPFLQGKVTAYVLEGYPDDYKYYDVLIGNGGTLDSPQTLDPSPRVVDRWQQKQVRIKITQSKKSTMTDENVANKQVQTRVQKQEESKVNPVVNDKMVIKQNAVGPSHFTLETDTVSQYNKTSVDEKLKGCNVSQIQEENDNVNIKSYKTFNDIVLPSLEQTETVDDTKINPKLTADQRTEIQGILKGEFTNISIQNEYIEIDIQILNEEKEPIILKPCQLPYTEEQPMKNEIQNMLDVGAFQPNTSSYSSSIDLIKKIDEKIQYCMTMHYMLMILLVFISVDDTCIIGFVLMMIFIKFDITIFKRIWNIFVTTIYENFDIFRIHNLSINPKKTKVEFTTNSILRHNETINSEGVEMTEMSMPDKIRWTDQCQQAVTDIQTNINNSPVLALSDLFKTFFVQTYANGVVLDAALLQVNEGRLRPCLFLSRKLVDRETRYSVIERECLGVVWAVQKLARYLLGQKFVLQTDHKPLKFINTGKTLNARICRWALILQQFDFTIEYISGPTNTVADFMSRNI